MINRHWFRWWLRAWSPEPMLTKFCDDIWHLQGSMSWCWENLGFTVIIDEILMVLILSVFSLLWDSRCTEYFTLCKLWYFCDSFQIQISFTLHLEWGGWGCEVSCGGHHRPKGKTTTGSALDGAVFDTAQILAYLVHNMSRSQLYLGFGHFGWLPSFFGQ